MDDKDENRNEEAEDAAPAESEGDDVAFEPEDNEAKPAGFGKSKEDAVSKLKEEIRRLQSEKQEYLDGWQRTKAEFANLRKRDEAQMRELTKYANEGLIEELLPALDSFDMAMSNKEAWEKADKNWRTGVEYIHSQLLGALERNGLKRIDPTGQKFDSARDTAIERVATGNEAEDGIVVETPQKGYELNGKIVRSPRVKVAEYRKEG